MSILFFSKSPEYGWLSNFSEDPFTLNGIRWQSVEHYYQAHKYVGTEAMDRIRRAETPAKARKAGQDRSLVTRPDWEQVKQDVMKQAVRAKFDQNRRRREQLLATGDEELIHTSESDLFWGRNQEGTGENRLGEILMEIRAALRNSA
jgi:ribA/ribD-fused uncharacterized protein